MILKTLQKWVAILALTTGLAGCGINTVPTLEEKAKAQWAEVQNQYQRRSDLIPNLVETVKGYAKQEQDTLIGVTEARAKATQMKIDASTITDPEKFKQFQDAQGQLGAALGRLMSVTEQYPDLKSNQNFMALQAQLEGTENRISIARRDYIASVQVYNTEVRTFPGNIWAKMFWGAKVMQEFTSDAGAEIAPKVKF